MILRVCDGQMFDLSGDARAFRAPDWIVAQWREAEPLAMSAEEVAEDDTLDVQPVRSFDAGERVMVEFSPGVWTLCEVED